MNYKYRKGGHTPLLARAKGLIERLPRIGKLKISCSLSQGIGALVQELDRITITQDFDSMRSRRSAARSAAAAMRVCRNYGDVTRKQQAFRRA
jgi:hypothetical protein